METSAADLQRMLAGRIFAHKDLYVDDGISGSDLERPGLSAFIRDALNDPRCSHLFIYSPDRLARPQDPLDAIALENRLSREGMTIIYSEREVVPRSFDGDYIGDVIQSLFDYTNASKFLTNLAERVLAGQAAVARAGNWVGGRAPYGHIRVLVDSSGQIIQELPEGMRVRRPGCHVQIRPNDQDKIRIWLNILQWCQDGLGAKKIARRLNEMGIPSPDAGRNRYDNGVVHLVSGRWSARTVLSLIRNCAIIGVTRWGVQSEGKHRRLGDGGSARQLEDIERYPQRRAPNNRTRHSRRGRVVQNPPSRIITSPSRFAASADQDLFDACQATLAERGRCQRGISRRTDPARYPLALRIWDMTDGCGHPMYAKTSGSRPLYVCGRYMKTSGAQCHHNAIDGEALLRFLLNFFCHQLDAVGGRKGLQSRLEHLAAEHAEQNDSTQSEELAAANSHRRLTQAELELSRIAHNLARAIEEFEEIIRNEWRAQKVVVERLRTEHEAAKARLTNTASISADTAAQVQKALAIYDELEKVVTSPTARAAIPELLRSLNLRLWLNFGAVKKGKRAVRRLTGGIITTGNAPEPLRPYGKDQVELISDPSGTGLLPEPTNNGGCNTTSSFSQTSRSEGISFTKGNRGDKI